MCFSRLTDSNLADCSIAESGGVERKGGGGQLSHMETVTSSIAQKHTRTHRHKNEIFMWLGNCGIRPVMNTGFKFVMMRSQAAFTKHEAVSFMHSSLTNISDRRAFNRRRRRKYLRNSRMPLDAWHTPPNADSCFGGMCFFLTRKPSVCRPGPMWKGKYGQKVCD